MPADCRSFGLFVLLVAAPLAAGCATSTGGFAAFGGAAVAKKDENGPPTPTERIKEFRELAKRADQMEASEREQRANELAAAVGSDPDVLVRTAAIRALGDFDTLTSSTALYHALQDSDPDVRIACCEGWARRGGPDAAKVLGDVIRSDQNDDVRLAAARALGEIEDQSAVQALAPALEAGNPALQWRAVRSLEQVTGKYYGEDVEAWRSYVQGGAPREVSIVRRLGRVFY